jgi:hypothetical protein
MIQIQVSSSGSNGMIDSNYILDYKTPSCKAKMMKSTTYSLDDLNVVHMPLTIILQNNAHNQRL